MRVVITGATGFIGKYLVNEIKNTYEVIILTRQFKGNNELNNPHFVVTDYSVEHLSRVLQKNDVLIHLAGQRLTKECNNPSLTSFISSNVELTEKLLIASSVVGIKQFILSSTIGVYSDENAKPYSEHEIAQPNTIYGLSKLMAEQLVDFYCRRNDILGGVLRISQCFGVGEKDTPVLMKFIKLARKKDTLFVNDNNYYIDEIYVKDVVCAFQKMINKQLSGIFNIGGGKSYSILHIAETVNDIYENDKLVKNKGENIDNYNNYLSITKAKNYLDWKPMYNLKDALVDMKNISENSETELKTD